MTISIIALLIGILLPVLAGVRARSVAMVCATQIRSQLQGQANYATDFKDYKPPLWLKTGVSTYKVDYVSPDVRWNGKKVGQGLLVQYDYITLDVLLDPSSDMALDVATDRTNWSTIANSGSSYVYFWRNAYSVVGGSAGAISDATNERCITEKSTATIMDINAEKDHTYLGEYAGRPWVSHPQAGVINIGFLDGSVTSRPNTELILYDPAGAAEELDWFSRASALRQ